MLSNNQKVVGHVPPDPTYDEIPAEVMNNQSQIEIKDFHKPSPVITGFLLPVYNGTILLLIWICFKVQKAVLKTLDRLGSRHINTIIKTNVVNVLLEQDFCSKLFLTKF